MRWWREARDWLLLWQGARDDEAESLAVFEWPNASQMRRWDDAELHRRLVGGNLPPNERSMAAAELRRREGRVAVTISIIAVVVAVGALLVSVYSAFVRP